MPVMGGEQLNNGVRAWTDSDNAASHSSPPYHRNFTMMPLAAHGGSGSSTRRTIGASAHKKDAYPGEEVDQCAP